MDPNECMIAGNDIEACSTLRSTVFGESDPMPQFLFPENKQWGLDTADWYCEEELCPPIIGNIYVYRDQNHVSNAFAASTAPLLWAKLQEIFTELGINVGDAAAETEVDPDKADLPEEPVADPNAGGVGEPSLEQNPEILPELGAQ